MSERAKEISAFVTPDVLYDCTVMPFTMKNAPSTFQGLMNNIVHGLQGCVIYTADTVIYSDTWEEDMANLRAFPEQLVVAKLLN